MAIFILEIVLKMFEHFWAFWASNWNVADFVVTLMCAIFEVLRYTSAVGIIVSSFCHR